MGPDFSYRRAKYPDWYHRPDRQILAQKGYACAAASQKTVVWHVFSDQ